jgi:Cupin-like domain
MPTLACTLTGIYRAPLTKLADDIPAPKFMTQAPLLWDNLKDVHLWTGNAMYGSSTSRLHADADDNLYFTLAGSKNFSILSPEFALHTRTVTPKFAVSPNGHSYHFDLRRIWAAMAHSNKTALQSTIPFLSRTLEYDTGNLHFSYATSVTDNQLDEPARNNAVTIELHEVTSAQVRFLLPPKKHFFFQQWPISIWAFVVGRGCADCTHLLRCHIHCILN